MITCLTLACVFGPYLLPYDSLYIDLRARFAPPFTGGHISRHRSARARRRGPALRWQGGFRSLVGFFAMLLSTLVGTVVGVIAGYRGGWIGAVLMRIVDAFLSFPSIFLLLALAAALRPSPLMITVIIAVTSWMEVARIVEARGPLAARARLRAGRAHAGPERNPSSCSARSCPTRWGRSSSPRR